MTDFILHHYAFSPYSEKIRVMLAYTEIDWLSVIHKEMPPRPFLEPLAGGYGRIPVAQIGADIFCDSNIISAEIAKITNKPELDLANANEEIRAFVEKVEGKIFFACVMGGGSAKLRKKIRQSMGLWDIARFFVDRVKMGASATTDNMIKPHQARKIVTEHLKEMEAFICKDFLFGDKPNIADFSAYHSLWFIRELGECGYINDYPKVCAWMDRIKGLGFTKSKKISGEEAIKIAKESAPRSVNIDASNENVSITPDDYRKIKTSGQLVQEDEVRWVIARENSKAGVVHVHFPKRGYKLN